jgi:hypothetical protein
MFAVEVLQVQATPKFAQVRERTQDHFFSLFSHPKTELQWFPQFGSIFSCKNLEESKKVTNGKQSDLLCFKINENKNSCTNLALGPLTIKNTQMKLIYTSDSAVRFRRDLPLKMCQNSLVDYANA